MQIMRPVRLGKYEQLPKDTNKTVYDCLNSELLELKKLEQVPEEVRYRTFEEAHEGYLQNGIVKGSSRDVQEFNSLMSFVFQGRKTEEKAEFERCSSDLINTLKDILPYYSALKYDDTIGSDVINILKMTEQEIQILMNEIDG